MKSYVFPVVLESDGGGWHAFVPVLEAKGASTWGKTREEALRNIEEVAQMVIESLLEDGEPIPDGVTVADEPLVAVNVG
jgi:predicted RNase H-like HicB family nuclease